MKIISLVPSITEALFDLGLNSSKVIGRTKFCIHPKEMVRDVEIIGGTKNLNADKIKALNPDLIIANKEENEQAQVEALQQNFKVLVTNISTLEDNYYLLKTLGNILDEAQRAQQFNSKINEIFNSIGTGAGKSCAYLIWQNPYMTVGGDTFINEILQRLGFKNIFADRKRYPIINTEDLREADFIFLSSEPFPFKQKHAEELQRQFTHTQVLIVDGEAFSWYGTHLAKCENYFKDLLNKCK